MSPKAQLVLKGAAFGGAEEALRGAPRLYGDYRYDSEMYLLDVSLGLAFGGLLPIAIPAAKSAAVTAGRGAVRATNSTYKAADLAARKFGVDTAVRTAMHVGGTTARKGVAEAFSPKNASKTLREARDRATTTTREKMRDIKDADTPAVMAQAVKDGDVTAVSRATDDLHTRVASALRREGSDKSVEVAAQIDEQLAARVVRQADEATAKAESRSAGAAENTSGSKSENAAHDLREAAREAHRNLEEVVVDLKKQLGDTDLSKVARSNAWTLIDGVADSTRRSIDETLRQANIKPHRNRITNKRHVEMIDGAATSIRKGTREAMASVAAKLDDAIPNFNANRRFAQSLNSAMRAALGRPLKKGESMQDAFEAELKAASDAGKSLKVSKLTDAYNRSISRLARDVSDQSTDPKTFAVAEAALEDYMAEMNSRFKMMQHIADNPFEDMEFVGAKWSSVADGIDDATTRAIQKQYEDSIVNKVFVNQAGPITHSLTSQLLGSGSPLARWVGLNLFEAPAGLGGDVVRGNTAAVSATMYDDQARIPVNIAYETMLKAHAKAEGWNLAKRTLNYKADPRLNKDVRDINMMVMREVNARQYDWAKAPNTPAHVKAFADVLTRQYGGLHDLQMGKVDGIHAGNKLDHYQHQTWDDGKIMDIVAQPNGRRQLKELFLKGYMNTGLEFADAKRLADAMVDQKVLSMSRPGGGTNTIEATPRQGAMDTLADIFEGMRADGVSEAQIERLRLQLTPGDGSPGYTTSRAPIDMDAYVVAEGGEQVRVIDLMQSDVPQTFARYSKEATARAALSEHSNGMLSSLRDMDEMLVAVAEDGIARGKPVNVRDVQNALLMMMGRQYDGQLPMDLRRARDFVQLVGMGGLGESQLAEFGYAIARGMSGAVGLNQVRNSRTARKAERKATAGGMKPLEIPEHVRKDRKMLSELQEITGLMEEGYLVDRRNTHYDARNEEFGVFSRFMETATGGRFRPAMLAAQSRFTGYGVIRAWEDQIAISSMVQDLAIHYRGDKANTSPERMKDLGIDPSMDSWLSQKFKDADLKEDGTIESLNINEWSREERHALGAMLRRHAQQVVQAGFVGEMSPTMNKPIMAFLMQFKTYPTLAVEKQQVRNLKFKDQEAAVGLMLNAVTSAASRMIRTESIAMTLAAEDRQKFRDERNAPGALALSTWTYMAGAGWSPYYINFLADTTGGGYRGGAEAMIPVLGVVDKYAEAASGMLDGDVTDRDVRNLQLSTPLGTTAFGNALYGVMRDKADFDADNAAEE